MTTRKTLYTAAIILFVLFASRMRYQEKTRDRRVGPNHPVPAALTAGRATAPETRPGNGPAFFENKGQAGSPQRVSYTLEANGVTCYFTPDRIVYAFPGTGNRKMLSWPSSISWATGNGALTTVARAKSSALP